ncbi:germ cell nuclear acidic protein-like [Bolinopsis microptera]|uniref:germ cell nuclear acidic protein-like n=1 Tax=Bolinopsis microptera TaxID=2820187 RepID=UPI0030795444
MVDLICISELRSNKGGAGAVESPEQTKKSGNLSGDEDSDVNYDEVVSPEEQIESHPASSDEEQFHDVTEFNDDVTGHVKRDSSNDTSIANGDDNSNGAEADDEETSRDVPDHVYMDENSNPDEKNPEDAMSPGEDDEEEEFNNPVSPAVSGEGDVTSDRNEHQQSREEYMESAKHDAISEDEDMEPEEETCKIESEEAEGGVFAQHHEPISDYEKEEAKLTGKNEQLLEKKETISEDEREHDDETLDTQAEETELESRNEEEKPEEDEDDLDISRQEYLPDETIRSPEGEVNETMTSYSPRPDYNPENFEPCTPPEREPEERTEETPPPEDTVSSEPN